MWCENWYNNPGSIIRMDEDYDVLNICDAKDWNNRLNFRFYGKNIWTLVDRIKLNVAVFLYMLVWIVLDQWICWKYEIFS